MCEVQLLDVVQKLYLKEGEDKLNIKSIDDKDIFIDVFKCIKNEDENLTESLFAIRDPEISNLFLRSDLIIEAQKNQIHNMQIMLNFYQKENIFLVFYVRLLSRIKKSIFLYKLKRKVKKKKGI
jgi:hypothetical protein